MGGKFVDWEGISPPRKPQKSTWMAKSRLVAYDILNLISNTLGTFNLIPEGPTLGKLMVQISIFQLGTPPWNSTKFKSRIPGNPARTVDQHRERVSLGVAESKFLSREQPWGYDKSGLVHMYDDCHFMTSWSSRIFYCPESELESSIFFFFLHLLQLFTMINTFFTVCPPSRVYLNLNVIQKCLAQQSHTSALRLSLTPPELFFFPPSSSSEATSKIVRGTFQR